MTDAGRPLPAGRPPDPRGHGARAGTPRRKGFDAVWQADSRLVREATVPMAAFAAVTERIKIGSGVVDCWTRNPARLAATFSTLDDLAPGPGHPRHRRVVGSAGGEGRHRPRQAARRSMREVVTAVRALLANETVTFDGEYVHLDGVELDYVYQERRPKDVPIYIGATGHADDGADRRDRRRRRAQLPRLARLQRAGARGTWHVGAERGRPHARRHRPAAARRVLGARGPRRPRSTWPA